MLYELLTGSTPLDDETLRQEALLRVLELIREKEPPRPSTRLSSIGETATSVSKQRKIAPGRLQQILKGELDWIVMKALDKDRTRRYETADRFADDVQRFLDGRAVLARPPSTLYRWRKFVKQNLAAVVTAVLFAVVLIVATAVSVSSARIAQAEAIEADKQRAVAERERKGQKKVTRLFANVMDAGDPVFGQLFSKYGGPIGRAASMEDVVRRVARDELAERSELNDVPAIRGQLLDTLGDIHLSYGDVRQSVALFTRADSLYQTAEVTQGAELARNRLGLATCNYLLGDLNVSQARLQQATEIGEQALESEPGNVEVIRDLAFGFFIRAATHVEYEDFDEAEKSLARAIELCESEDAPSLEMLASFARLYSGVTAAYRAGVEGEDLNAAVIPTLRAAASRMNSKGTLFEPFLGVMTAEALVTIGRDATPAYEKLHTKLCEAVGENHFLTVFSRFGLAEAAVRFSDFQTANRRYEELIAFTDKHLGRNHSRFAMILQKHGMLVFDHWRDAEEPDDADLRKAHKLLQEAVELRTKHLGEHRQTASSIYGLARIEAGLKNYEEAIRLHQQALPTRVRSYGLNSRQVSVSHYRLAGALWKGDRLDEAVLSVREMLRIDRFLLGQEKIKSAQFGSRQLYAAQVLAAAGSDPNEIQELLADAVKRMKSQSSRYSRAIKDAQKLLETR